jgi:hypothetical protein
MSIKTYSTGSELHPDLARKLSASLPPEPRKPTVEKRQGRRQDVKLTDAQVLECRARFEFEGWSIERLMEEYGTTRRYMRELVEYLVRSKLIPKRA